MVVHYVVVGEDGDLRPLCGDWAGSPSWSRLRDGVTCPRCRALLERAPASRQLREGRAQHVLTD